MTPAEVIAMRNRLGDEISGLYSGRVDDPIELADYLIESGWVVAPPKNEGGKE